MDPASATIMSVGFAGSIATLAATAIDSYRILSNIYVSSKTHRKNFITCFASCRNLRISSQK